jgi:hypothetical protein
MGLMKAGDAVDNNVINTTDFNLLKLTFGKAIGDPGYDDRADFTGDQLVNTIDFNLMKNNFGQGGVGPIGPFGARPCPPETISGGPEFDVRRFLA